MRKITLLLLIILCIVASCGEDSTTDEPNIPTPEEGLTILDITPNENIYAKQIGGIFEIILTANKKWNIRSDRDWISLNPKIGDKSENKLIKITVGASNESEKREAYIIVTCDNIIDTIVVDQLPLSSIVIDKNEYIIEGYAQSIQINIHTNIELEVVIPDDVEWINYTPTPTKNEEGMCFTFEIEANSGSVREAIVTFKDVNSEQYQTVLIQQNSTGIEFPEDGEPAPIFSSDSGTKIICFNASQEWKASILDDDKNSVGWFSITPTSGMKGSSEILISAEKNKYTHSRVGAIQIVSGKSIRIVKVTQQQIDTLISTPTNITVGARETEFNVNVNSNIGFQVDINSEWITQNTTRAMTETELSFTAQRNNGEKRTATIVINSGIKSETITITQEKSDFIIKNDTYSISAEQNMIVVDLSSNDKLDVHIPNDWIHIVEQQNREMNHESYKFKIDENRNNTERRGYIIFSSQSKLDSVTIVQSNELFNIVVDKNKIPNSGGEVNITVESNVKYSIETPTNIDWITHSKTRATKSRTTQKHIFKIAPNKGVSARQAAIKFNYKSIDGEVVKEVEITQEGGNISVNRDRYELDAKGGEVEIEVEADTELSSDITYHVTKGEDWINIEQSPRSISKTFVFNVHPNQKGIQREGEIEIRLVDRSSVKIKVVQYANSNAIHIPDANFKRYVICNFDQNNDSEISKHEALQVTQINSNSLDVESLIGIEYFCNLKTLYCNGNKITSIDLSKNILLEQLDVANNELKSLDISKLPKITELSCDNNPLELFNLGDVNPIRYYGTSIHGNFKKYPNLKLKSAKSFKIISSKIISLRLKMNNLTSLNLSESPKLEVLYHHSNPLKELNLGDIELKMYNHIDETNIIHSYNYIMLDLENSNIFKLISSKTKKMVIQSSELTSIDISNSPALTTISVANNKLNNLDLSKNRELLALDCKYNNLSTLDLKQNRKLKELDCRVNRLKIIDISNTEIPSNWSNCDADVTIIK